MCKICKTMHPTFKLLMYYCSSGPAESESGPSRASDSDHDSGWAPDDSSFKTLDGRTALSDGPGALCWHFEPSLCRAPSLPRDPHRRII